MEYVIEREENDTLEFLTYMPTNISLTNIINATMNKSVSTIWSNSGRIQIPLYTVIFLLAVVGNSLVILTLVQNTRMRTVTNVFLLNLAISDLLLGVLCMPFTLVGTLLRDFIFGSAMCKLLPYLQATSVSVSAWTLVVISVERYYAICHPLRSRRWQTLSHSYKVIAGIWTLSLLFMLPIAALSQLIPTNKGHHKCRECWPSDDYERAFNIFLDLILLILPLIVLAATYSLIIRKLWRGMQTEHVFKNRYDNGSCMELYVSANAGGVATHCALTRRCATTRRSTRWCHLRHHWSQESGQAPSEMQETNSLRTRTPALRRSNVEKSLFNKKRVIQMLFVVVLEFFVCWTPLYVINTIALFNPAAVYNGLGYTAISFFQLLAYSSSCCNPITYCFMSCGFRKSFLNLFRCFRKYKNADLIEQRASEIDSNVNVKCLHVHDKSNL